MRCQRDEHEVYLRVGSELEDSDNDSTREASTLLTTGKANSARWRDTAAARRRPRRGEQTRGSTRTSRARRDCAAARRRSVAGVVRLPDGDTTAGEIQHVANPRRRRRGGLALTLKGMSSRKGAQRGAQAALATGEARLRDGETMRELASRRGGGGGGARRRRRRAKEQRAAARFRTELGEGRRGSNAGAEAGLGRRAHWKAAGRSGGERGRGGEREIEEKKRKKKKREREREWGGCGCEVGKEKGKQTLVEENNLYTKVFLLLLLFFFFF